MDLRDRYLPAIDLPEKVRADLQHVGDLAYVSRLGLPPPGDLAAHLSLEEGDPEGAYVSMAHDAKGAGSSALLVHLVLPNLAVHLRMPWGGRYANKAMHDRAAEALSTLNQLIAESASFAGRPRLRVFGSDMTASWWAPPGGEMICPPIEEGFGQVEALRAALRWTAVRAALQRASELLPERASGEIDVTQVALETKQAAESASRFALDLHLRLCRPGENLIFSPFSIFAALAMALQGARAGTARDLAAALHLPPDPARCVAIGALLRDLTGGGGTRPFQLHIANALWGRTDYPFLPQFLDLLQIHFGAGLRQTDFDRPVEACQAINEWVAAQTQGKIANLLSPDCINALTQLILTNAIYFKGQWRDAFNKSDTIDRPFFTSGGEKLSVPTMTREECLPYLDGGTFQAAEFPYRGDRLAMAVFVPSEGTGLESFESRLTAGQLAHWLGEMRREDLRVYLPRFEARSACRLAGTLKAMGMGCAFGPDADFSGMDGGRTLAIAEAIHQAYVNVNEEGTEAAAATAINMATLSIDNGPGPRVFKADRPFLFLIRDRVSGCLLFLGRVANPSHQRLLQT